MASEPAAEWRQIFAAAGSRQKTPLLRALHDLGPLYRRFRAERFYPGPEHRHFSRSVWGALVAGREDALFSTGMRYIALLIVIAPRTAYPLHARRIEEACYLLSGSAD